MYLDRRWSLLVTIGLMAWLGAHVVHAAPAWPSRMGAGASSVGSATYSLMSVWAPYVNRQLGTDISVQPVGGLETTTRLVHQGDLAFGLSTTGIALEAWNGEADWAQGTRMRDFRVMMVLEPYVTQFWTLARYGITSIQDLGGAHVSLNRVGTGAYLWSSRFLAELGIQPRQVSRVDPAQSNELLRDGIIQAAVAHGSVPHPAILELSADHDVVVFGVGTDLTAKFSRRWPSLTTYTIPAGTYKNQSSPIVTTAEFLLMVVHKDLPEDLVYELVKATFEGLPVLARGYAPFGQVEPSQVATLPVPLHKGAYRYFTEIGVQVAQEARPID